MSTTTEPSAAAPPTRARRTRRLTAVLGGAAAPFVLWTVVVPIGGVALTAKTGATSITVGAVIAASLFAGLMGWLLLSGLERYGRRPRRSWTITALVVLALSLTGPLSGGPTAQVIAVLAGMHLVTGAVLIPLLAASANVTGGRRRDHRNAQG